MAISPTAAQLTTQANSINRTKYFPIEFYCTNMLPNTTYNAYIDGILINAFCKPFGGKMGSPLTSDGTGKLLVVYMFSIPYVQSFLVNPNVPNNNLIQFSKTVTFVDPFNRSSTVQFPFCVKSG